MVTFIFFIISLLLLSFLVTMKSLEMSRGQRTFLTGFFSQYDGRIESLFLKIQSWWGHVNFKNTKLISLWIIVSIRNMAIALKRRFDHQQSHFFTKREPEILQNKGSVSFFLKNVSDYKKTLREGKKEKTQPPQS